MELESITGAAVEEKAVPPFFRELVRRGWLDAGEIRAASDGFYAAAKSLADILVGQGITTFPNVRDEPRDCDKFFDDWYCYAVPENGGYVYSLFKLREQEFDAKNGLIADGDTPGVTVSFIAFDTDVLAQCLSEPTVANRKRLNQEINRVVAARQDAESLFSQPKGGGTIPDCGIVRPAHRVLRGRRLHRRSRTLRVTLPGKRGRRLPWLGGENPPLP